MGSLLLAFGLSLRQYTLPANDLTEKQLGARKNGLYTFNQGQLFSHSEDNWLYQETLLIITI